MKFKLLIASVIAGVALTADCDCDKYTTCCDIGGGEYGCCPYENATCCEDKEHCCPNGYACNLEASPCELKNKYLSFLFESSRMEKINVQAKEEKQVKECRFVAMFNKAKNYVNDLVGKYYGNN